MKKLWGWLRTLDAGDWIAVVVLLGGLAFVVGLVAANTWSMVVGSLQPEMVKFKGTEYDLIAQRSMSAAAWWMVVVTGIATLIGGLSLGLIALTLREARRSADAAIDAVDASRQAVIATREVGQAQVRAYLIVKSASLTYESNGNVTIKYTLYNSGQTPARRVELRMDFWIDIHGKQGAVGITSRQGTQSHSDVPAGEARDGKFDLKGYMPPESRRAFTDLESRAVAVLTPVFDDVFGLTISEDTYYGGTYPAGVFPTAEARLYRLHVPRAGTPVVASVPV